MSALIGNERNAKGSRPRSDLKYQNASLLDPDENERCGAEDEERTCEGNQAKQTASLRQQVQHDRRQERQQDRQCEQHQARSGPMVSMSSDPVD